MELMLKKIASMVDGKIKGNPDTVLTGMATIENTGPGDLTFPAATGWAIGNHRALKNW